MNQERPGPDQRTMFEKLAHRRRDRLSEDFRRTHASPWPTWAYAVALALMVGAIAVLMIVAANYD